MPQRGRHKITKYTIFMLQYCAMANIQGNSRFDSALRQGLC